MISKDSKNAVHVIHELQELDVWIATPEKKIRASAIVHPPDEPDSIIIYVNPGYTLVPRDVAHAVLTHPDRDCCVD